MPNLSEEQIRTIIRDEMIKVLGFSSRIPLPIDQAFRDRFLKNLEGTIIDGGDGGTVNVDTYNSFNVLVPHVTGKRTLTIDGTDYNVLYQ